jgi:hypothetical protein
MEEDDHIKVVQDHLERNTKASRDDFDLALKENTSWLLRVVAGISLELKRSKVQSKMRRLEHGNGLPQKKEIILKKTSTDNEAPVKRLKKGSDPSISNETALGEQKSLPEKSRSQLSVIAAEPLNSMGITELNVTGMKVAELKKQLKDRGLKTNGLKSQLVRRLNEAIAQEMTSQPFLDKSKHTQHQILLENPSGSQQQAIDLTEADEECTTVPSSRPNSCVSIDLTEVDERTQTKPKFSQNDSLMASECKIKDSDTKSSEINTGKASSNAKNFAINNQFSPGDTGIVPATPVSLLEITGEIVEESFAPTNKSAFQAPVVASNIQEPQNICLSSVPTNSMESKPEQLNLPPAKNLTTETTERTKKLALSPVSIGLDEGKGKNLITLVAEEKSLKGQELQKKSPALSLVSTFEYISRYPGSMNEKYVTSKQNPPMMSQQQSVTDGSAPVKLSPPCLMQEKTTTVQESTNKRSVSASAHKETMELHSKLASKKTSDGTDRGTLESALSMQLKPNAMHVTSSHSPDFVHSCDLKGMIRFHVRTFVT